MKIVGYSILFIYICVGYVGWNYLQIPTLYNGWDYLYMYICLCINSHITYILYYGFNTRSL